MALRQIVFSLDDEFMAQGIVYDASTDTYVRLRRSDTLSFMGTSRKINAFVGNVQLTWLYADHPDLRQRITDWWLNKKEPTSG